MGRGFESHPPYTSRFGDRFNTPGRSFTGLDLSSSGRGRVSKLRPSVPGGEGSLLRGDPMARHRASTSRRRRIRASVLSAVLLALIAALASQPAANALTLTPKGKIVLPRNADVVGSCKLEVNKVDKLHSYDVTVTLTVNARPAGLDGYRANKFTQVFCSVYDSGFNYTGLGVSPSANGPTIAPTSTRTVLPYSPEYKVCAQAYVKLKNGDDSFTPLVCA